MRKISVERWLELSARGGTFNAWRYGFTHRAETKVWNWRSLSCHVIYLCVSVGWKVIFSDQTIDLEKGGFLWVMPGVKHKTQLHGPRKSFRTYYLRFDLTDEDGTTPVRLKQDFVHRHDAWHVQPYLRELVSELQSPQEFHSQRVHANLTVLSAAALAASDVTREGAAMTPQQRLRLHSYINSNIENATPQNLADEVGLSMPYFRRLFTKSYGMSPMHWILRQRILLGAIMLSETELTAKQIAYRLGYKDPHLFSRQFKQVMGVCARPFRHGAGAEPSWDHIDNDMNVSPLLQRAREAAKRVRRASEVD